MKPSTILNPIPNLFISFTRSFCPVSKPSSPSKFNGEEPSISVISAKNYGMLLDSCIESNHQTKGRLIHAKILITGLGQDPFLACKLITFYSASKNVILSRLVFNGILEHNVFLWNSMIRGYVVNGFHEQALALFYNKRAAGMKPDSYTFSCVLKACALLSDRNQGKVLHDLVRESGLEEDLFVSNSLLSMFCRCGRFEHAIQLFNKMPERDRISWNSIITGYIEHGFFDEAMEMLQKMIESGYKPDSVTILSALAGCPLALGREIHGYAIRNGFHSTFRVRNSLVSMYGKCGRNDYANILFRNSIKKDKVAWNALISGYAQNGFFDESLALLHEMRLTGCHCDTITYSGIISAFSQNDRPHDALRIFTQMLDLGLIPDAVTITSILPSCSDLQFFDYCQEIHAYTYRHSLETDIRIRNALISVYSKCKSIQRAHQIFTQIFERDVISWSTMIAGYAQNGHHNEAINTFRDMCNTKTTPNPITITSVLSAFAQTSSLKPGKELHLHALKHGLSDHTYVGSALIDMYSKCGKIEESRRIFDRISERNLVSWNAMILAYAIHGQGGKALALFKKVEKPDHVTFLSILSACSHGGLVDQGTEIFNSIENFGLSPSEGHYACMVDMLGRVGQVKEALDLIEKMPVKAGVDVWMALLGACRIHSNLNIGIYAGRRIIELGSENPGFYVLFSNFLAGFGRWEEVEEVRRLMEGRRVKKRAGCSWIEVDHKVHAFAVRDMTHTQQECIYRMVRHLNMQIS
ncbi:hypothetical protein AMTR_s00170p00032020 [Amborella trichopoda]|uniref:Pentacotripeptide-repeat region of PRORP domain-containing protein n=2 Tax=Amborella trichopoda TaxID=13333 RepID=W1NR80_AMBTC|nr:hypothetical protein AMTR_s00170p00032020 [Amborella trichopoda]